mmetsp:Transcript_1907/g.11666  ORF Transcript_1907/g.11666 Transcript_1907/m.11666 type:complete len:200 (-) Transcript_1907:274-873(-)
MRGIFSTAFATSLSVARFAPLIRIPLRVERGTSRISVHPECAFKKLATSSWYFREKVTPDILGTLMGLKISWSVDWTSNASPMPLTATVSALTISKNTRRRSVSGRLDEASFSRRSCTMCGKEAFFAFEDAFPLTRFSSVSNSANEEAVRLSATPWELRFVSPFSCRGVAGWRFQLFACAAASSTASKTASSNVLESNP